MYQKGSISLIIAVVFVSIVGIGAISLYTVKKNNSQLITTISRLRQSPNTDKDDVSAPNQTPTSAPMGLIKGAVRGGFYSKPIEHVKIFIKGKINKVVKSNTQGEFTADNLPIGSYDLSFEHPEYIFSPTKITIKEGENIFKDPVMGRLKNPKPLLITGHSFSDKNNNGIKDGNDSPLTIFLSLYYKSGGGWVLEKHINPDSQGKFSFSVSKLGSYKLSPARSTFYNQPKEVQFVVDGYGGSKNYSFGYYPTQSQAGFKIYVFNDKNENGIKDNNEEYIHYQTAEIINISGTSTRTDGNSWKVAVPPQGYQESSVDYGSYTIKLVPESSSWSSYYKITKGEASISVNSTSGHQTVILGAHKLY